MEKESLNINEIDKEIDELIVKLQAIQTEINKFFKKIRV